MARTVFALFSDSDHAGQAVAQLKEKGFTKDISVVSRDWRDENIKAQDVKKDLVDGAVTGATTGALAGTLAVLLAGAASVLLPGLGPLLITGPLAASWIAGGAVTGALTGGLLGALVDLGLPEEKARLFEEHIQAGEVLVAVTTDDDHLMEVQGILASHDCDEMTSVTEM